MGFELTAKANFTWKRQIEFDDCHLSRLGLDFAEARLDKSDTIIAG